MDLNSESGTFRSTDPEHMALSPQNLQKYRRGVNWNQSNSQSSVFSQPHRLGEYEALFDSWRPDRRSKAVQYSFSWWEMCMEGSQQLDGDKEASASTFWQALSDLQNFSGKDAARRRVVAVEMLESLGNCVPVELFIIALGDPYWDVRAAAVHALGAQEAEKIPVKFLASMLEWEKDESVRETIVCAVGRHLPIGALVKVLRADENWMPRQAAAQVLSERSETPVAVDELLRALQYDPDEGVRAIAARSLGMLELNKSRPKVLHALYAAVLDSEEEVSEAAKEAIKQLEGRYVQPHIDVNAANLFSAEEPALHIFEIDTSPTPDTHPEIDTTPEQKLSDSGYWEEEEPWTAGSASPIWGEPGSKQVVYTLANFLRDKRGYVSQPKTLQIDEGTTIFLTCFYQYSRELKEVVLQSVEKEIAVESITAALEEKNELIRRTMEHVSQTWGKRTCMDLLVVSMDLFRREKGKLPVRVVVSGMSGSKVRRDDTPVLRQIMELWAMTLPDPKVEGGHMDDLAEVKVWYQPAEAATHEVQTCR